jgi:outer membrane protein
MPRRLALSVALSFALTAGPSVAQPKPPQVSLKDAVHRAMARNPTAEVAEADVRRSESLAQQARAGWYPSLSANATYTRLDDDRRLADRIILGANQFNANVLLTVPVVAPRAWVQHARAKDALAIARADADDVRRQIAIATARAYLTVLAQHRVVESAERARDTARAHEEFAATRLSGGIGNRLDAVRASQERATSDSQLSSQLLALTRAQEALGVLIGESGPVDVTSDTSLGTPPTLAAALGEAEQRRSDVIVERERIGLARKTVDDAWADYMPMLSVVAQPWYQAPPTFTMPTTGWQAQLLLSLPLFDGGARYAVQDERRAFRDQTRSRLDAALRQARSEVRVAFEAIRRADDALADARDAARLANEARSLAELAYRAGATSNLEVIDAERRSRDADTAVAVAEDAARQARLDLLAACGRFP